MSLDRRRGLLELCAEHQVLLVEDAAYAEIYYEDEPPPSLYGLASGEGILKVGTFSKPIATGLRVGWVQAREDFIAALSQVKFDMGSSPILLRALADYVGSGKLDQHLERMRPVYAAKCEALCQGLEDHCSDLVSFIKPKGGFFLWVECIGARASDVTRSAADLGLSFPPGALFYLNREEDDTSHIRLALSTSDVGLLREVGPRLREAFERLATES
jgi:2-aminoadipate transaminase